jgi:transposase
VEILLTAAALPATAVPDAPPALEPTSLQAFDWHHLIDPDLWSEVPPNVPTLLKLLTCSDLYVQDEVDVRLHPTLTRVWSRKGRRGQRQVRAPGRSRKFVGFGAIDWREGWLSIGYSLSRTADVFCQQLDHLVERSSSRGRRAMVLLDNLGIHTYQGSKLLREALERHGDSLILVYTPAYDPEANPTERLWPHFRLAVTHNHHRDDLPSLYGDTVAYFERLDVEPDQVLSHIGSPYAISNAAKEPDNGKSDDNADPTWK